MSELLIKDNYRFAVSMPSDYKYLSKLVFDFNKFWELFNRNSIHQVTHSHIQSSTT